MVLLAVSGVSFLRVKWQAWHCVTFRHVLEKVESRFAWKEQYFVAFPDDVFRVSRKKTASGVSIVIFRGTRTM